MKQFIMLVLISASILTACSDGKQQVPPTQPTDSVQSTVIDSPNVNGGGAIRSKNEQ